MPKSAVCIILTLISSSHAERERERTLTTCSWNTAKLTLSTDVSLRTSPCSGQLSRLTFHRVCEAPRKHGEGLVTYSPRGTDHKSERQSAPFISCCSAALCITDRERTDCPPTRLLRYCNLFRRLRRRICKSKAACSFRRRLQPHSNPQRCVSLTRSWMQAWSSQDSSFEMPFSKSWSRSRYWTSEPWFWSGSWNSWVLNPSPIACGKKWSYSIGRSHTAPSISKRFFISFCIHCQGL